MDIVPYLNNSTNSSTTTKKRLTNHERQVILEILLIQSENGSLQRGSIVTAAAEFSVSTRTVQRVWKQAKESRTNNGPIDVSSRLMGHVGRKRIQLNPLEVTKVDLRRRTNIHSMSEALNMSKSTLHRRIKEGCLRRHSNAIKPTLTDANKRARLEFCLSMLEPQSLNNIPTFKDMLNFVHIDEKWFYMTKESEKYYLLPEEDEPLRTCKSKRFIAKVMFLAAVARPRFDYSSNEEFSGKIGIFPFIFKEPAKRNSKNRVAGTMETKPIVSVTKEVIRECLIKKVLPTIREKWPSGNTSPIFIQQDNAKPHISLDDHEFLQAASSVGYDIRLCFQPPNSPDLNVLDLGFFRAIQTLQHQEAPKTIDELLKAVEIAFDKQSSKNLNFIFLTLQSCMVEIMKDNGGNNYRVPHMKKKPARKRRNFAASTSSRLSTCVECAIVFTLVKLLYSYCIFWSKLLR